MLSRVRLFATPGTVAHQGPLSIEFSRQEYWRGVPFPSSGDLPAPETEPTSHVLQADPLPSEPPGKPNQKDSMPFLIIPEKALVQILTDSY